jgi:hypothetical protein
MKRKETESRGCVRESVVLERREKGDMSSKRHNIRSRVFSEDTRSSGRRVKEDKV